MKPPKLNKAWHEKHRMPANATLEQRIEWHLEHRKHCGCRPIPAKLAEVMRGKGLLRLEDRIMDVACPQCGKIHNLEEMEPSYRRPDAFVLIPQHERESRTVDSKDSCMIWSASGHRVHCFLRTLMPFTVRGLDKPYSWGVWVEVSPDEFKRAQELWNEPNQSSAPPLAGRLANALHCYPESLGLGGLVHLVSPQQVPWFRLDPNTDHPLVRDQNREVSPEETLQWLGPFLHGR